MTRELLGMLSVLLATAGYEPECSFVSRDISPDGRFEIELCRINDSSTRLPGHASDALGKVLLKERQSGRILRATTIDMVQLMDTVTWSQDRVHIKLIADWSLPRIH